VVAFSGVSILAKPLVSKRLRYNAKVASGKAPETQNNIEP